MTRNNVVAIHYIDKEDFIILEIIRKYNKNTYKEEPGSYRLGRLHKVLWEMKESGKIWYGPENVSGSIIRGDWTQHIYYYTVTPQESDNLVGN